MLKILILIALLVSAGVAQSDPRPIIDAEHAFARLAAEKGSKAAFLANMTDDAVVFNPEKINAKSNWSGRKETTSLLTWDPNYADISSDGAIGYTTGNWEFRPKGKDDAPVAFGDFITVWKRQSEGVYKWVIDIGVSHDRPATYSTAWSSPRRSDRWKDPGSVDRAKKKFAEIASRKGLAEAYRQFAAFEIRSYREGKMPILGRARAIEQAKMERGSLSPDIATRAVETTDLAYVLTDYTRKTSDGKLEKGNLMQIWKCYDGKWRLVLDVIKPVPSK